MMDSNRNKSPSGMTSKPRFTPLEQLKHIKHSHYLKVISDNQGILTDRLSEHIKSNNHHNASQSLNNVLIPIGWVIAKFHTGNPCKSWRWYLIPVKKALKLGIDKRLRLKIYRLLEAANDE